MKIPEDVLEDIINRAKESWADDKQMQKHCIAAEKEGYIKLQSMDFAALAPRRGALIEEAQSIYDDWDEIYRYVAEEVAANLKFRSFESDVVPNEKIEEWKQNALRNWPEDYTKQLSYLEERASKYGSVLKTREQVDPIKSLLIELEGIIANECYNGNIQNYSSWGELESEGRKFRYPVTFYKETGEEKRKLVPSDIPSEELITGHYAFGANELNIYRALLKVIMHLREKHGLSV